MKILVTNKRASFDYFILDTLEVGIVLKGTEIKSLKNGKARVEESFVMIQEGEAYILNLFIPHFSHGNINNHEESRSRKLLMHKKEILKLEDRCKKEKLTIVVLKLYLKEGRAKLEIALAKGKKLYDKRESEKNKDIQKNLRNGNLDG